MRSLFAILKSLFRWRRSLLPVGVLVGRMRTQDSIKVMAQVWELNLPEAQKLVLLGFGDHANDEGLCYPSIARIAWKCGLSDRQVKRIVKALRRDGLLEPISGNAGGRYRTTAYIVRPEKGVKLSPFVSGKGDVRGAERVTFATRKGDTGVTRIIKNHQKEPVAVRIEGSKHMERGVEKSGEQPLTFSLKAVSQKMRPLPSWVKGELAEDLYRGVHGEAIRRAFFDARFLKPDEQLKNCISAAVTSVVTSRVATLKNLNSDEIERRVSAKLLSSGTTLLAVKNFDDRQRQIVTAVERVLVQTCIEMLRAA